MIVDKDWNYVATCGPLLLVAGALASAPRRDAPAAPSRRPLLALGAFVLALAAIYSLAAPWLEWPLTHPLFVALDLAQDRSRGVEILSDWAPPSEFRRVW